jgi:DNA-binding MarR family transcriptional regulator
MLLVLQSMAPLVKLFTMLNSTDSILARLRLLGLSNDEAKLYVELLKQPTSHLKLAHATGINRTKVYRLADQLEKRSLITMRTDDRGTFLVAADPSTLEVEIVTQEAKLKSQRAAFTQLLPFLSELQEGKGNDFAIHTYEGSEGFKQMLWHELKTQGENLIFGSGTIEDLVPDKRWAEKHRAMTVETKYRVREIINPGGKDPAFTLNQDFLKNNYSYRLIPEDLLPLYNQTVVYNDTVGIYHWRNEQKVGTEIINAAYADMMRAIFEQYWRLGQPAAEALQ